MDVKLTGKSEYTFNPKKILGNRKNSKFSFVYPGTDLTNNKKVVIKRLNPKHINDSDYIDYFKKEAEYEFVHHNIQKKIDFIELNQELFIIYDYIEGIDLLTFAKKHKKKIKNIEIFKNIFIDILTGLKYLHQNNYIHADIKPHNIIIDLNKNYKATIIDFGQVQNTQEKRMIKNLPFSLVYSPPEQFLKAFSLFNPTTDFYSLGITMYHVLTGKLPYKTVSNPLMLMALQLNKVLEPHKKISPVLFKIIKKATSKYIFPKPYIYYPKEEVIEMLKLGQSRRYQNCDEFIADLKKL